MYNMSEKAMATHSSTLAWKIHGWRVLVGYIVHGVAKTQTWLRDFIFTFHFHALEKEMATHSRVLAWRVPGTGAPGGLPSMGSHRVGHDWSDLAAAERARGLGAGDAALALLRFQFIKWRSLHKEHQCSIHSKVLKGGCWLLHKYIKSIGN